MEYEITVPTEQYGNIKITEEGDIQDAVRAYKETKAEFNGETKDFGAGLPPVEWREAVDLYLIYDEPLEGRQFEQLDEKQLYMIHEIDKMKNRTMYKDWKADQEHIEHIRSINEE